MKNQKPVGKYEISPYNEELMKLMKPFVSKDKSRESLMGVNFDTNGAVATNGLRLVLIRYKNQKEANNEKGLFDPKTLEKMKGLYRDYIKVIPKNQPYFAEVKINELMEGLKVVGKSAYKKTPNVRVSIEQSKLTIYTKNPDTEEEATHSSNCRSNAVKIAFLANAEMFLEVLSMFKKMNAENLKLYFTEPSLGISIYADTDYGKALLLLMPANSSFPLELDKKENLKGFSNETDTSPLDWGNELSVLQDQRLSESQKKQIKNNEILENSKATYALTKTHNWAKLKDGRDKIAIVHKNYAYDKNEDLVGLELTGLDFKTGKEFIFMRDDIEHLSESGLFKFDNSVYPETRTEGKLPRFFIYTINDGYKFFIPTLSISYKQNGIIYKNIKDAEVAAIEQVAENLKEKLRTLANLCLRIIPREKLK